MEEGKGRDGGLREESPEGAGRKREAMDGERKRRAHPQVRTMTNFVILLDLSWLFNRSLL